MSKGAKALPEPTVRHTCAICKHVADHRERLVCMIDLPPHIATTGRVPLVHAGMSCSFFQKK